MRLVFFAAAVVVIVGFAIGDAIANFITRRFRT